MHDAWAYQPNTISHWPIIPPLPHTLPGYPYAQNFALSAGSRESVLQLAQTRFDHQTAISQDMTVLIGSGGVSALALNAWILCLSVDAPLY